MTDNIRAALLPALDAVVLAMSSETFWDGLAGSHRLRRKLEKRAKVGVTLGSDACRAALRACGRSIRRLGCERRSCA
jgi:maleate isomerase